MMLRHAALLSVAVALLALAETTAAAATPQQSAPDQYERQRAGREAQPLHRVRLTHSGHHRFSLLPPTLGQQQLEEQHENEETLPYTQQPLEQQLPPKQEQSEGATKNLKEDEQQQVKKPNKLPELQVGCAEGSVQERTVKPTQNVPIEVVKTFAKPRHKRQTRFNDNFRWQPIVSSGANLQTPTIVSSAHLRSNHQYFIPIWGNPRSVPVYFPSRPILFNPGLPPSQTVQNQSVTIGTRMKFPSWGLVDPVTTTTTARPASLAARPQPPLFHKPSITDEKETPVSDDTDLQQAIQEIFGTSPRPTFTTSAAAAPTTIKPRQLSRCVWSIISCCNPTSTEVKLDCFERLGCPGAFWDVSPCSKEITIAALNAAQKFYEDA